MTDYFACLADGSPPIRFWPPDPGAVPHPDARYFARALAALEGRGLVVYLTWRLDELPSYGEDVVAVVLGDEPGRIPAWFDRVGATFKAYGTRPSLGVRGAALASRLGVAALLELAEKALICAPGAARFAVRSARARHRLPEVFPIPIGYFEQLDLPITPILDRPTDVFFAGSVAHFAGEVPLARRIFPSSKAIARREMLAALGRAGADRRVDVQVFGGFGADAAGSLSTEEYSRRLMAARVCLAPRGNSVETFRLLEGMRYGCVVVCDPLPRRWFYDGAPVVTIARWRDLPRVLDELLADERGLVQRHEATLAWWRERCSEEALGAYIAARV